MSDYDDILISLPLGWILCTCHDWDDFCEDVGLNPYCINEGVADPREKQYMTLGQAKKHGLLCDDGE